MSHFFILAGLTLVVRTVSNGMTDRSCCVANRALVLVQDGASDTAIVILSLQGVAKVVALVLAVVLAEHAEVILHFLTSSLTRRRSTD